jgi:hypothetical protein
MRVIEGIYITPIPRATARATFFHRELIPREAVGAIVFFRDI